MAARWTFIIKCKNGWLASSGGNEVRQGAKNPGVMQPYRPEGCRMGSDKQLLPSYLIYIDWLLFVVVDKNSKLKHQRVGK